MTSENEQDNNNGGTALAPPVDEAEEVWDILRVIETTDGSTLGCRMEDCKAQAVVVWKSNLDAEDDVWPMCEACQETEFGGWPEGVDRPRHDAGDTNKDTTKDENPMPTTEGKTSSDTLENEKNGEDDDEPEESWDIKKVMTMEELNGCTIKCATETCSLAAAVLYLSSGGERWYSCLDCQVSTVLANLRRSHANLMCSVSFLLQESDFDGWPENLADLPISFMADEHKALMISKCSKYKKTAMPVFAPPSPQGTGDSGTQSLTPRTGASGGNAAVVTPTEAPPKKIPKPSKEHLEMHRKWQAAAEAAGGPGSRIVLSKPTAKKMIFDYLYDAFSPMTITQIYEVRRFAW